MTLSIKVGKVCNQTAKGTRLERFVDVWIVDETILTFFQANTDTLPVSSQVSKNLRIADR